MKLKNIALAIVAAAAIVPALVAQNNNVIDEVVWVVGDEPIFKSDVEEQYKMLISEGNPIEGDPYCIIPEQMAIQKLFLNQAKIDSISVPETRIFQEVENRINYIISNVGSKEKMEEYFKKNTDQVREQLRDMFFERATVDAVQESLVKGLKITPSDVRKYYDMLPADSIPLVAQQVEVQIISINPKIPQQTIDEIKDRLRTYSDKITKGESEFSTMAILHSEDGSAMYGGELGFKGKGELVPEFSAVAFNLNDTKKVSKIVETEYGFHIIQLIEKRGDRINCRHILLRPKVAEADLTNALHRLDSVRTDIINDKFTFEYVVERLSQDKDTRNSRGVMVNPQTASTKFEMSQLPQDIAKQVSSMKVGDISKPFVMINQSNNKEVVAIVKLTDRIEGHRANLSDDYQTIKRMYEERERSKIINDWVKKKQKETYVRIEEGWRNCDFKYDGWVK